MAQRFDWRQYRLEQLAARLGGKAGRDLLEASVTVQNKMLRVYKSCSDGAGRSRRELSAPIGSGRDR